MKKLKAILNLSRASANDVAAKASTIVTKMTGNTLFPTPFPALADITTQIGLLNTKLTEQNTAFQTYQQKTSEVQMEKDNLINMLDSEGSYVETFANNIEANILSAGYDVRQKPTPNGLLAAPVNLLLSEGIGDGDIVATWNTVKGAKSYIVELSLDVSDPEQWEYQGIVTKAKYFLGGMESGVRVWIRVAAVNAAGQGGYSDPATKTVP